MTKVRFTTGDQEGVLVISTISEADGVVANVVMQKALISGISYAAGAPHSMMR